MSEPGDPDTAVVGTADGPAGSWSTDDRRFMRDALALGHRNLGSTWPNPSVGAVLVQATSRGPIVVGRGVTQPGGRPHAEVVARGEAGDAGRGATLYVTLEPCSHTGRTGPCADAMIDAGVARVVSAVEDPNPLVAGFGHEKLRRAGILVDVGLGDRAATRSHRGHFTRVRLGRPALTLKLARTADGFAAGLGDERLLITGALANAHVHLMRAHADAIAVGIGTVLADDPELTVRLPGMAGRSPLRIVFDSQLATPPTARLVAGAREVPTWIVASTAAPVAREERLLAAGVEVLRTATTDAAGRLDLGDAMRLFAVRGLTRIFCEGGPRLADALAAADLVDEAVLITGQRRLDRPGLAAIGPAVDQVLTRMSAVETYVADGDRFDLFERPS